MIPYISPEILEQYQLNGNYYWSENFTPEFYIDLAKRGLISTSMVREEYGDILLPELQEAYAVLDFKDLHISRKVNRLFKEDYNLVLDQNPDLFIPLLKKHHGDECWFTDSYIKTIYSLFNYTLENNNFRLNTIFLYHNDVITAGEIGYFIGSTYTSLTGFFNKEYNNWGTFQLVLLANKLNSLGIDFWNLGHPYMEYKFKLGARIFKREDFLKRWFKSTVKNFLLQ